MSSLQDFVFDRLSEKQNFPPPKWLYVYVVGISDKSAIFSE